MNRRASAGPPPAAVASRYTQVTTEKSGGITYTPNALADFVANQVAALWHQQNHRKPVRVFDPAVGNGALLLSLLASLGKRGVERVKVYGFETDRRALNEARERLAGWGVPAANLTLIPGNFLQYVLDHFSGEGQGSLFRSDLPDSYDLIIANPPYVRTQVMGAGQAQALAGQFRLSGRVDLYYAFVVGIGRVLGPQGTAGIILSNRFMTTRSGSALRKAIPRQFHLRHIWDLGDTKLFDAAVLPSVILLQGNGQGAGSATRFTSIYETRAAAGAFAAGPVEALALSGVVQVEDGRRFLVQHGELNSDAGADSTWHISTPASEKWLETVGARTWRTFGDLGSIRVGVKTCADPVFIRADWDRMPAGERPELLRPLATHHMGRPFRASTPAQPLRILYPHETRGGRRQTVDLALYPRTRRYLENHRAALEARKYLLEAGRKWYEIWVPQDPAAWAQDKVVFRDISEKPMFWLDRQGSVVNGDCYWLAPRDRERFDLLWLALGVANSTFIEAFYDRRFHNKLYAGRRRFMTQYVEQFPLPDPDSPASREIIDLAQRIYDLLPAAGTEILERRLAAVVWKAFGVSLEEPVG